MDLRKETIKTEGANLCRMRSNLLASVDIIEFQTADAHSSVDLTNVIYRVSRKYVWKLCERVLYKKTRTTLYMDIRRKLFSFCNNGQKLVFNIDFIS
jgi:hypothetical protein